METIVKEGKDAAEILEEILKENNLTEEEIVYTTKENKGKLFKGSTITVTVIKKEELYQEAKEFLKQIIEGLGLEVSFEMQKREGITIIKIFSNRNAILIGKNGQTLKTLELLVKQMLNAKYGVNLRIMLDVENYRKKKERNLEFLAKKMAKEVVKTNTEVHLENMNSYERRIIHNCLTNFKGVKTESEGVEPNRHIVIKPE